MLFWVSKGVLTEVFSLRRLSVYPVMRKLGTVMFRTFPVLQINLFQLYLSKYH